MLGQMRMEQRLITPDTSRKTEVFMETLNLTSESPFFSPKILARIRGCWNVALMNREKHRRARREIERHIIGQYPTRSERDLFFKPPCLNVLVPNAHKLDILSIAVTEQPTCLNNSRQVVNRRNVIGGRHGGILTLAKDCRTRFSIPMSTN